METTDIRFLKMKLRQRVDEEAYESAAKIKQWIIDLGGDPFIEITKPKIKNK